MSWLDTQTKELLGGRPPGPEIAYEAGEHTLVLLDTGLEAHWGRLVRAAQRVRRCPRAEANALLLRSKPLVIATGLSLDDAMLGQFEFICVDAVAVFLRDEVVAGGSQAYLRKLYASLRKGAEFGRRPIQLRSVPEDDDGRRFLDQFVGMATPTFPLRLSVPLKKARIMKHWARKIGAEVE